MDFGVARLLLEEEDFGDGALLAEDGIGRSGSVECGEVPHGGEGEHELVRVVLRPGRDGVVFDYDDRARGEGGDVGEELVTEDQIEDCHFVASLVVCGTTVGGGRIVSFMLVSRSR